MTALPRHTENVFIVGHGPSLLHKPLGHEIDAADLVIRQKTIPETHPEYFGTRTDALVGSWNQMRAIEPELWVFIDSRFDNLTEKDFEWAWDRYNAHIDADLCRKWDMFYRQWRKPFEMDPAMRRHRIASDDLGHRHMSSGLHALLYAAAWLEPKTISLIGYDNIKTGEFTWSITRGPGWTQYPDHRWDVEHEMVKDIAKTYGTEVVFV